MSKPAAAALAAIDAVLTSRGFAALPRAEQLELKRDLGRIVATLDDGGARDPFAIPLETPGDLRGGGSTPAVSAAGPTVGTAPAGSASDGGVGGARAGTEVIGERARTALEAVDFPAFVAGLMEGTFQAIVDATAHQLREYARLVASIAQSVDDFARDNVTPGQVRDWFAARYPNDLVILFPKPGERGYPRLLPRRNDADESPAWLANYGLQGRELTEELTEGPLLEAGARSLAEERLQTLATMVLMGVNRIVVSDGEIRAKLQFHAAAREQVRADVNQQQLAAQGIAGREIQTRSAVATMVSTVAVNAQADVAVKADLLGEVAIRFRSETFDLNRFAEPAAMELITRHSRQQAPAGAAAVAAPAAGPAPRGAP